MAWKINGSSQINAFGIQYEAKAGFSASQFSWAA
jgi:hypothetical protein